MLEPEPADASFGIIDPKGKLRKGWDFLAFLLVAVQLVCSPLELAFLPETASPVLSWVDIIIGTFFLLDVAVNCRTGVVMANGKYITSQKEILRKYCCSFPCWFFIDLISTLPLLVFSCLEVAAGNGHQHSFLGTLKVSKLAKQKRLLKQLFRLIRLARWAAPPWGAKIIQTIFEWRPRAKVDMQTTESIEVSLAEAA